MAERDVFTRVYMTSVYNDPTTGTYVCKVVYLETDAETGEQIRTYDSFTHHPTRDAATEHALRVI